MAYEPLLVPFLQVLGTAILLSGVFGLTLLYLSSSYGKKKEKVVDVEFVEVPANKPYTPGDIINKKA